MASLGSLKWLILLTIGMIVVVVSVYWPLLTLYLYVLVAPLYAVYGIGAALSLLMTITISYRFQFYITARTISFPFRLLLILILISVLWASHPTAILTQDPELIAQFLPYLGLMFCVAVVVSTDTTHIRRLLWIVSVSATIGSLVLIHSFMHGLTHGILRYQTLIQTDIFCGWVMLSALFILYELLIVNYTLARRILLLGLLLLLLAGLIFTGARSGWVGFCVGALVMVWQARQIRYHLLFLFISGIMTLFVYFFTASLSYVFMGRLTDPTMRDGSGRLDIWQMGLHLFTSSPIIGIGWNNFPLVMQDQFNFYAASHNTYLGITVELGCLGLILFCWWIIEHWRSIIVYRGTERALLAAIFCAILVQGFFIHIFLYMYFWLAVGILEGARLAGFRAKHQHCPHNTVTHAREKNAHSSLMPLRHR